LGDPLFREHGRQVAALCWRPGPQILLITSLTTKRWIIPKGWLAEGLTAAEAAAREALEEAGVTGKITSQPIGSFHYLKERKDGGGVPCSVDVFALEVTGQLDEWPEKGAREISSGCRRRTPPPRCRSRACANCCGISATKPPAAPVSRSPDPTGKRAASPW
jgi:ADP-ribose pyrophosphatase YjhB (NUDIX family)